MIDRQCAEEESLPVPGGKGSGLSCNPQFRILDGQIFGQVVSRVPISEEMGIEADEHRAVRRDGAAYG